MCSTGAIEVASMSTNELVDAAAAIAAELAQRDAPDSAAVCMRAAETLARATDLRESALAGLVGRVDASGEVRRWGYPSARSWLRSRLGMREARAKERINLARERDRLPDVTRRLAQGELSYGYAATIASAVTRLNDDDCTAAEKILLDLTEQGFSAGKVAAFGNRITDLIAERDGTDQAPDDAKRGYERSWIDSTRSLDGGRYIRGWLNAEDAAIWDGTLAPLAKPAGTDDHRDLPERTAAALTSVLSGGHKATKVTIICDLDTLTGGAAPARLTDGTPIPAAQARRIALNAGVSPLILGRGHVPLYLGRTVRFASPAQRRVLEALNPTCAVQGCEVPGPICEVDHVNGWVLGNTPTDIDNLTLTCAFHNRFKAARPTQIYISRDSNGRYIYRLPPPGGTRFPHRPPPPASPFGVPDSWETPAAWCASASRPHARRPPHRHRSPGTGALTRGSRQTAGP
ncbi:HNH endonuclease signature motif containing protein [Actinomadura sp. 7K507]|uniref:HNH endonuclease signature motif containing protein n=1 Tax=Actinomadura sp. 7K507 TaxID=2530365 RepID=UPI001048785A|nr:HNH endonuclease signature motif containing protein [Actinomadura sp. 7K507]TDC77955.1 HNH endonuclease [Actinomadura sp. 7K507]